jgi:hypothetical protein
VAEYSGKAGHADGSVGSRAIIWWRRIGVLPEQLGRRRVRLNDDQRRRMAARGQRPATPVP